MKHTTRLPQKTAKSTASTRMTPEQMAKGSENPTKQNREQIQKQKRKKLNQRGSTYAAPPAPNPTAGNLRRGTTRMGGY